MSTAHSRRALFSVLALTLSSCGGAGKPAPASAAGDSYPDSPAPEVNTKEDVQVEKAANAEVDEPSETTPIATSQNPEYEPLELTYRVSPDGIRVQLEGVEFVPEVEAVKIGKTWGVKLTVEAVVEGPRVLLSPEQGPLAFGGVVNGKDGKSFGDKRMGEGELLLSPEAPTTFSRTWPNKGEKGIVPGQELELHVGLWGLGLDAETRVPVRRFVVVKMRAYSGRAHPRVEAPRQ